MATTKEGYLPSDFLVVEDPEKATTFHLQVKRHGKPDHGLMGAAWAALHGGYRGNKYEGPGKAEALAKLKSLYKSEGMDLPSETSGELGTGSREWGPNSLIPTPDSPRFLVMLSEPPATGLIRIPIAVTGTWAGAEKKFCIELSDLEDIRENFAKKLTGEINVDYEHASEVPFGTGGPVLSAGRITKLDAPEKFKNGNRESRVGSRESGGPKSRLPIPDSRYILWGWYEPTDRARQLIAHREYRYISPAIRWGTKDKVTGKGQGTVLTSVALVNKPFLEEMPEIHLCEVQESGVSPSTDGQESEGATNPKSKIQTLKSHTLVSLEQLHVPGPVNQISVAYEQPKKDSADRSQGSGPESRILNPESASEKEKTMAKSLKLKCFTDGENKGKIGVFDGDEMIGLAELPEGFGPKEGDGEGDGNGKESKNGNDSKKRAEVFASEVGATGRSLAEIAALVKRGLEAPVDNFVALSEAIHDGHLSLTEAGRLADAGRVKFSTILLAQEAERKVDNAIRAGKVLPKNRQQALRVALSDAAAFTALVEEARPVVDLTTHGHAGGGEQPTAQQALMAEVNAYAKENKCSVSVALSEVTKLKPDLWREYSEEIVRATEAVTEEAE